MPEAFLGGTVTVLFWNCSAPTSSSSPTVSSLSGVFRALSKEGRLSVIEKSFLPIFYSSKSISLDPCFSPWGVVL
jgi:hypothetical protein